MYGESTRLANQSAHDKKKEPMSVGGKHILKHSLKPEWNKQKENDKMGSLSTVFSIKNSRNSST